MESATGRAPLAGLLVVALEQAVAAPYCSLRLAQAGARVIKVERAEGDFARGYDRAASGLSSYFVWLNHGKESIALDVKRPSDRAVLDAMLARADVFLQNLAPGAAERLGLGSTALRDRHPRLVCCNISGYGRDGRGAGRKAYDMLLQAETGLAAVSGSPDAPGRVGISVCDIACGMQAHAAILEALIARGLHGQGDTVDVSLFDSLADWMAVPLLQYEGTGREPARVGLHHVSIAPYGLYATAGGESVVIAVQNEREWARFCAEVLAVPALADDARFAGNHQRVTHRTALDAAIDAVFSVLPRHEIERRLAAADIAFGAVHTMADFSRHPQLRRQVVDTDAGPVRLPAAAARRPADADADADPDAPRRRVPGIDAHGAALRREFAAGVCVR